MLRIGVLGPLDISQNSGVILAFESLKARALLAYLAVESDRLHSRETLASMLWPDRTDSSSLANLRHTLASLRATLGERYQEQDGSRNQFFTITSNTIQFTPQSNVRVDLQDFEHHLVAADQELEKDSHKRIERLTCAVQLCRGRFMEGFSLKGCSEFEDWLLLRRENISLRLQRVLHNLADAQMATGDWEQTLVALRHMLLLDPWNEAVHRKVMSILAIQNQRSAALNQFERCRKLLMDELGVQPEDETMHLYEQIRAGLFTSFGLKENRERLDKRSEANSHSEKLLRNFFVGRTSELARLHQSLKLTLGEQGQLVFITGEPGIGKTCLAEEFMHQAMAQEGNLLVAAGRCNAITGFEDPYMPFREALQMLLCGNEVLSGKFLTLEHRRRLTEFLPETVKSLLAAGPNLIDTFIPRETLRKRIVTFGPDGQVLQQKLKEILSWTTARPSVEDLMGCKPHEAMYRMLCELSRQLPLILFIDDLQWADAASISLLHFLTKHLMGSRILILGAYRPQDLKLYWRDTGQGGDRQPLERVRMELQREFGEIDVNLDHSAGMEFINALVNRDPNCLEKPFRQTLFNQTNGNALFAVELLQSMRDRGHIVQSPSGRWVEGEPFDWEQLPARVEAVIAERIGRLYPEHQKLLQVASVEGEIFTAEVLAQVLGLDERQVISWLSGPLGQEQQIVKAVSVERINLPSSGHSMRLSRYRFSHFLFQRFLYHRIDSVERSALHEEVGIALERLSGPATVDRALQLAWHFQQGNFLFRAVEYLLAAGKQADNLFDYEQAKKIYNHCLDLIRQLPETGDRDQLEIQVQHASTSVINKQLG